MRRRLCALSICRSLFLVFISVTFISTASATLIAGSQGTTYIIGNNPSAPNGSFKVQIDYSAYDGTSLSDPIGITADRIQIAFKLTHLGSGGETPVLKFGRFSVFGPVVFPADGNYASYGTTSYAVGTGKAPSSINNDPPPKKNANRAKFMFQTGGLLDANFASGEISKTLVVSASPLEFPASILLEIDSTNSGTPAVSGDVYVNIIPEPCSLAIFGTAILLAIRRRAAK